MHGICTEYVSVCTYVMTCTIWVCRTASWRDYQGPRKGRIVSRMAGIELSLVLSGKRAMSWICVSQLLRVIPCVMARGVVMLGPELNGTIS